MKISIESGNILISVEDAKSVYRNANNDKLPKLFTTLEQSDVYVSADYHLGKKFLHKQSTPEYAKHEANEKRIIELHNKVVKPDDTFLFLGDLSESEFGEEYEVDRIKEEVKKLIKTLNGKIVMIRGNNDTFDDQFYKDCGIYVVTNKDIVFTEKHAFSHYPCNVTGDMLNIHGHIHGSRKYWNIDPKNHIDVWWDMWGGPRKISDFDKIYESGIYKGELIIKTDGDTHK